MKSLRTNAPTDYYLVGVIVAMVGFGLLMVYSASFIYAHERFGDGFLFIRKQIFFAAMGLGAMVLVSKLDYRVWLKWSYPLLLICTLLLAAILIPGMGYTAGGATRWMQIGSFTFQPAELAKFAIIVFVARQIFLKQDRIQSFRAGILGSLFLSIPCFVLLLFQPDFGSVVLIGTAIFALMFLGGVPVRFLLGAIGVAGALGAVLIYSASYRMARFMTFLDPWQDPSGSGFQIIQSLLGLHNGSLFGVGLGNGKQKLFFLPEAHNDFILSVIGEELGLVGVAVVIIAFSFFVYRGLRIAWISYSRKADLFGMLVATGVTLLLGTQAFVNIGVVTGMLPTKGLTLPFISSGGSALLVNLFGVGILLSVARGCART